MGVLLTVIVIALGIWAAWKYHNTGRLSAEENRRPVAKLGGTGRFDLEVVGESHYQPALRAIAGRGEVRHQCTAHLVMDDDNPYDAKAVRVDIEGKPVGHLSRDDARAYRRQLRKHGDLVGRCDALICGGGPGRMLGVWLDLPTADHSRGKLNAG